MNLHDIRIKNTLLLIANYDSKKEFAEAAGILPAQVNQLTGKNPTSAIGNILARRIEAGCGKPAYWLDTDHDAQIGKKETQVKEITLACVRELNKLLMKQRVNINKIDPTVYDNLLRHIIDTAIVLGRVEESSIEGSLRLANINKTTNKG